MVVQIQLRPFHAGLVYFVCIYLQQVSVHQEISAMHVPPTPFAWNKYPNSDRDPSVDLLHGISVPDPYRWLENPHSQRTKEFIDEQNNLTKNYMDQFQYRSAFQQKVAHMIDTEHYSHPFKKGDYYYFFYNSGRMDQEVIKRQPTLDATPELFFDPNVLSDNGSVTLAGIAFSKNGTYFAYVTRNAGSDWITIRVKNTNDKSDLPDVIEFSKTARLAWTSDEKGFFYTRFPKHDNANVHPGTETNINLNAKAYYHKLGTPQTDDVLVWEDKDNPEYRGNVAQSQCAKYVLLFTIASCAPKNKVWIAETPQNGDFSANNLNWTKIEDRIDHASFHYITNEDSIFYFRTNMNAPLDRVVKYDLKNPGDGFVEVIPQDPNRALLSFAEIADYDKLVLVYCTEIKTVMHIFDLHSAQKIKEIGIPPGTDIQALWCIRDNKEVVFTYSGFITPVTFLKFIVGEYQVTVIRQISIPGYDPNEFESKQVFYESKDGTRVPMYVYHRQGIALDGSHPAFLHGYGGFAISISPAFSVEYVAFMKHFGGVIALPNIRGGGEFGEEWHLAGARANKQNTFDDFQWAAKYLLSQGYTVPNKLAIHGQSNGGLLVGACINQSPDLFSAAIVEVGVLDMLRFHKFTIGHGWCSEYGHPDIKKDFECLLSYSPLHNVKSMKYPATLIVTGDHDDRVVPSHSYKFISELQFQNPGNPNPLLIHIDRDAGHGAGATLSKELEEIALMFSFVAMNTGAEWQE